MSRIHEMIESQGRDQARDLLGSSPAFDAAAHMMSIEDDTIGVTYSGFALTSLPHRSLPDDQSWEKRGNNLKLLVEPGTLPNRNGTYTKFGVPYGAQARLILIYLQTQAKKQQSPEIELGRSMYDWLTRMGVSIGGKTYKMVRDQANRISACRLTFSWNQGERVAFQHDSIIKSGLFLDENANPNQSTLWDDRVTLSETFYKELVDHAVPISEEAIKMINNNSMSIDIYIWLAYRLHALSRNQLITWKALDAQFGGNYKRLRDFRKRFIGASELSLAVYRDAKVDITDEGLILHPSRPPIPEKTVHFIAAS
ncbi:MAG: replication protein RepA [Porticoccaceae bacterium]